MFSDRGYGGLVVSATPLPEARWVVKYYFAIVPPNIYRRKIDEKTSSQKTHVIIHRQVNAPLSILQLS